MTHKHAHILPLTPGPLVLVVDDEATHSDAVARMVQALGFQVRTCHGGRMALGYLGAHPRQVRLLMADLQMPGMDGGELVERARDLDASLLVVLMAGPGDADARDLLGGYRDLPLLWKPVNLEELTRMFVELFGASALEVGPPPRQRLRRRSWEHQQV